MAQTKRIMISLPDSLLKEIDGIVYIEKKNRSQFIREAMRLYIRERKKMQIRESLKVGYEEMGELNSLISEIGLQNDTNELIKYEARLTGCE
ncbi:CopG family ribbon-helix-helix protein [Abyssisolibacter fermentans]|uniref:CopG family ribbon-helix-helix protein n=1 Tax=Abyssisolibacter fermentans TaxID=1766203 RepID=UPI00082E1091|nr:ribbon-helix-helix protein, CopG family [Abyssisolibacter fermentans]